MIVGRRQRIVRSFSQLNSEEMAERFANESRKEKESMTLKRKVILGLLLLFILAVF